MFFSTHVEGQITINGQERNLKRFRRQTAYIMQDHDLHSFITVMEAMHFSANLKVGSEMTQTDKKLRVSMSMFDRLFWSLPFVGFKGIFFLIRIDKTDFGSDWFI